MVEVLAKRNYTSKTHHLEKNVFELDAHCGHIHYKDADEFVDCDYHLADQGTYWSLTKAIPMIG